MDESKKRIITDIVKIPANLKLGERSTYAALHESPYEEIVFGNNKSEIKKCLRNNPGTIDEWLLYSADQRKSEGWFIICKWKIYTVGYLEIDGKYGNIERFIIKANACATYIQNEIRDIIELRRLVNRKKKSKRK